MIDASTVAGALLLPRADRIITPALARDGVWEREVTSWLTSTLRPGHTFIDVGAHVGYFSVLASTLVGPTGTVIAIEPEPRNLDLLRRNLARNGCANSVVVPVAAHSTRCWMSLALDEENRGAHHLVPLGAAPTIVECMPLDALLPPKVDVVKIDAQGYDATIIEGMMRTLAANPQLTVIAELSANELHRRGVDPARVLVRLEALGFELSMFDRTGARGSSEPVR